MPTLLLVEDEAAIALLVRETLEDAGWRVLCASDAFEASKMLEGLAPQLSALLTDINLGPGPSGFDVAAEARVRRPDLPVVYITGHAEADLATYGVPGSVLVPKPFIPAQVTAAVRRVLASGPPPRAMAPAR